MRDEQLPLARRHAALRCAVGHYCPLGFNATWAYLAATARPSPDLRRDPEALLRALDTLEASRAVRLEEAAAFAARRHREKALGRRTPRATDSAHLRVPRWPGTAPPSRLGLVAAVANRRSAFEKVTYPDETLYPDSQAPQFAALHTSLGACATSYLRNLGHLDGPAHAALTETLEGINRLVRPGHAPLNVHLLQWLRFANLLTYAAEVGTVDTRLRRMARSAEWCDHRITSVGR
ncbi:hypothetical protein ABZ370_40740 [Streptomyces sp. NPDC005962]|uniref:hypothetical protein n=1 Tax=Streptomyces sp. NPDC005962 TaxID=3154466 RepID=UPI0033FCEBD4